MSKNKSSFHFAWIVLIGLSIMAGFARGGINTAGGLFLTPVSQDLKIGMGSLTLYFSISALVILIFLPLAGKMMAKYEIKFLLIIATILQAGSFAMFGFMNSVWGWYIFSIPMAIGSIFVAQMAGPVLINNWFKKSNGLAIGIMMAAVGLFGAVLQPLAGNLIASEGWRSTYKILGVVVIAVVVPVILLTIRKTPRDKGLQPYGGEVESTGDQDAVSFDERGVTAAVARKSSAFYALVLFFFLITSVGSFAPHVGPFAMGLGYDVQFAGNVMGSFMLGLLIGSLMFGFMSDKIGAKNTAIFAMVTGLVAVALLIMFAANPLVFRIGIGIYGFVTASIGVLGPLLTSAVFGNREYSQIYATAAIGLAVAGIVALPAYGFVYDLAGSYTPVLYTIAVMLILNIGAVIFAFRGKKKLEQEGLWN
ncbi:MFS transporter [Paenibacillus lutrae]|uniref:MFS transporter n=1 Tax=Paenibacillus lutrae TaxID=2078573 RepID=A0A7X3FI65_9BACL|nr:MFS transporter [Paenibacillus lutrae]MVO99806.1 MFS transporter [Paenibacillus lutrae]